MRWPMTTPSPAPKIGIDNKGGDFEYVKIHRG